MSIDVLREFGVAVASVAETRMANEISILRARDDAYRGALRAALQMSRFPRGGPDDRAPNAEVTGRGPGADE